MGLRTNFQSPGLRKVYECTDKIPRKGRKMFDMKFGEVRKTATQKVYGGKIAPADIESLLEEIFVPPIVLLRAQTVANQMHTQARPL